MEALFFHACALSLFGPVSIERRWGECASDTSDASVYQAIWLLFLQFHWPSVSYSIHRRLPCFCSLLHLTCNCQSLLSPSFCAQNVTNDQWSIERGRKRRASMVLSQDLHWSLEKLFAVKMKQRVTPGKLQVTPRPVARCKRHHSHWATQRDEIGQGRDTRMQLCKLKCRVKA